MKQNDLEISKSVLDFEKSVNHYNDYNFKEAYEGFSDLIKLSSNHMKFNEVSVSSEMYLMKMYSLGQHVPQNLDLSLKIFNRIKSYQLSKFNGIFLHLSIAELHFIRGKDLNQSRYFISSLKLLDECLKMLDEVKKEDMADKGFFSYASISFKVMFLIAKIYALKDVFGEYSVEEEIDRWQYLIHNSDDNYIKAQSIYYLMDLVVDNYVSTGIEKYDFNGLYDLSQKSIKNMNDHHPLRSKINQLKYIMDDLNSLKFKFSMNN